MLSPPDVQAVQAAQNVVPVAVTAGDEIEGLRQWASGRCLSADRAGVHSRSEAGGGRVRRAAALAREWRPRQVTARRTAISMSVPSRRTACIICRRFDALTMSDGMTFSRGKELTASRELPASAEIAFGRKKPG